MTPATTALAVLLAGEQVAQVQRTRHGALKLTYRSEFTHAGATPLSLSLPPEQMTFTGAPVEAFLWGLLPESPLAREAVRATHGADPTDPLSLLQAIGKDCAGAVQFCLHEEVENVLACEGGLEPATDADIESRLAQMRRNEGATWTMPGEHWSLGGMQDKLALRRESDTWLWAHGSQPTTHIVKPGIRNAHSQALVEHITMRAAHYMGLNTAWTEYCDFKSERSIVVTRFDRTRTREQLIRSHQEDLCQALGIREKYEEMGGPSVMTIVSMLREQSSSPRQARDNVGAFVDALIYNTIIAAPDAHARNYSILLEGDQVRLAPLYDMATALAHDPHVGSARPLSMSVGGIRDATQICRDDWWRLSDDLAIDGDVLVDRVAELIEGVLPVFRRALDEIDDDWDGQLGEVRARLLPALEAHVATL